MPREQLLHDGAEGDDEGNEMNAVQRGKAWRKYHIAYDDEQRGLRDSIIRDLHGGFESQDDNDNESDRKVIDIEGDDRTIAGKSNENTHTDKNELEG